MTNKARTGTYPCPLPRRVKAIYHPQAVSMYRGNPLIEALPPIVEQDLVGRLLASYPPLDPKERKHPAHLREHFIMQVTHFMQPLAIHLDLFKHISGMLRIGYVPRNPAKREFYVNIINKLDAALEAVGSFCVRPAVSAPGMAIVGPSGVGKTTGVEAVLQQYPQVIVHGTFQGRPLLMLQLVYLKLDCPPDGSLKGLCISFFTKVDQILGTNCVRNYQVYRSTLDTLIPDMARVAALQGLGLLVIDEMQNLSESKSGGAEKMMNYLVFLMNEMKVPVLMIGTYKAHAIFTASFRQARRSSGAGAIIWNRIIDPEEFHLLCRSLWRLQWLRDPGQLTPGVLRVLYEESQGIVDLVIKLFTLAQIRALNLGQERLTPGLIRSVAIDCFKLVRPLVTALAKGEDGRTNPALSDLVDQLSWEELEASARDIARSQPTGRPVDGMTPGTKRKRPSRIQDVPEPNVKSAMLPAAHQSAEPTLTRIVGDAPDAHQRLKEAGLIHQFDSS